MYKNKKVFALIMARANSSWPYKNIQLLSGLPLLHYSICPAANSEYIDEVVVSTENSKIKRISKDLGASVVDRPSRLSKNNVSSDDVLFYTVPLLECDIIVYLQPTDLFKRSKWIDECIEKLVHENCSSAFIGCADHKHYWKKHGDEHKRLIESDYSGRQYKQPIYREDSGLGAAIWSSTILVGNRLGNSPIMIPKEYVFFDVHNEDDLRLAETYLNIYPDLKGNTNDKTSR